MYPLLITDGFSKQAQVTGLLVGSFDTDVVSEGAKRLQSRRRTILAYVAKTKMVGVSIVQEGCRSLASESHLIGIKLYFKV